MPGLIKKPQIVALAGLLQNPVVSASCENNCGCNEACGCKDKPNCCESKCACDQKGDSAMTQEQLVKHPNFLEMVKNFDAKNLKTIEDFQALAETLKSRVK